MRRHPRSTPRLFALMLLLPCAWTGFAEPWQADDIHLSMQPPTAWGAFEPSLLEAANKQVRHVTGRSFIAGYAHATSAGTTLIFPYLLVQYEPYADLPEADRPTTQLDLPGKLALLSRVVDAMKPADDLPETIDLKTFAQQFGSNLVRPLAMTDDGRFDLAGEIPTQDGSDPIRYHTHGVMGKEGVAMVTVFGGARFDELAPVIEGPLRTLAFAEGFAYADLPDAPPPNDATDNETTDATTPGTEPTKPDAPDTTEPVEKADAQPQDEANAPADPTTKQESNAAAPPPERSSGALILILGVMGVVMLAVVGVVVYVTHQKAQARRERARARRERLEQNAL